MATTNTQYLPPLPMGHESVPPAILLVITVQDHLSPPSVMSAIIPTTKTFTLVNASTIPLKTVTTGIIAKTTSTMKTQGVIHRWPQVPVYANHVTRVVLSVSAPWTQTATIATLLLLEFTQGSCFTNGCTLGR